MIVVLSNAKTITRNSQKIDSCSLQTSKISQKRDITSQLSSDNDSKKENEDLSKGINIYYVIFRCKK